MRVSHQIYGEGTKIREVDNKAVVRFDTCGELTVPKAELLQVLHS